jgi:hypothetical protein
MTPEEIEAKRLQDELEGKIEKPEPKLDDDGNEIQPPAWMAEDGDDGTPPGSDGKDGSTVPLSALIKTKQKLKGKIGDQNEELEALRTENAQLKQSQQVASPTAVPKRPRHKDFDDDDKYEDAMDKYEEEKLNYSTNFVAKNTKQTQQLEDQQTAQTAAVDAHYERAEKLVAEHSISPEVFQKTDIVVKEIIESVMPKQGEAVFNHLVSVVGEGSEKTMFFIGRNKAAQAEFHSLLAKDKSGLQAALYLGRIAEKVNGPQSLTSRAPAPAAQLKGDNVTNAKDAALQKKWAAAHNKGNSQEAYDLKKQARKAGIDTKAWR